MSASVKSWPKLCQSPWGVDLGEDVVAAVIRDGGGVGVAVDVMVDGFVASGSTTR
jgi:hypothetical protein